MDKNLLQYFIAKAGTTQKSLAKELNVTPETFSRKAKNGGFTQSEIKQITELLGLDQQELLKVFFQQPVERATRLKAQPFLCSHRLNCDYLHFLSFKVLLPHPAQENASIFKILHMKKCGLGCDRTQSLVFSALPLPPLNMAVKGRRIYISSKLQEEKWN